MPSGILLKEVKKLKIEDNHYTYRIETKDSSGALIDFVDIDTVEPLRCAYDVQDELNLETNEHIKRVEEIVLNATSEEYWYVDEARTSDTHLVCYFEEVQLMANADHPMVDTDRSIFQHGKINSNEHQNTNFICTHVLSNGVSRIYMSIDKEQLTFQVFNNETIKDYIANNPITIWYAIRYPVVIPRSMSKGHLLTLSGQTDISISSNGDCGLPLVKFNIGDTQYNMDVNPIHLSSTTEGTQIRNIVLEGNTPINYARGNGVNTTEATSNTRYDFEPFYDGKATIPNTVEGGYISAKLYGDTMVNIAKPYGETPLLTATNNVSLCDDLLGANEESIVLADGEITEGRIIGNSIKGNPIPTFTAGNLSEGDGTVGGNTANYSSEVCPVPNRAFTFTTGCQYTKVVYYDADMIFVSCDKEDTINPLSSTPPSNAVYVRYGTQGNGTNTSGFTWIYNDNREPIYSDGIQSVVNPIVYTKNENLIDPSYFRTAINISLTDNGIMVDGNDNIGWQTFTNSSFKVPLLSGHTYKLKVFLLEGEYTGGNFRYNLSNNTAKETPYTNTFTITPTTDVYLTTLSFYSPKGVGAKFGVSLIETTEDLNTYIPYKHTQATLPYTLNKLPNGVADYIDVVNKVHVQRVGVRDYQETDATDNTVITDTTNTLYELATPIYTPLTEEQIAQLPLSAYADGYVMLSSDQLMPSFEFRMRASNRYQVDMLETGYYYLNAPVGNVKLGTASVDVQQMPCIVKVDNVGTGDSGYRLGFDGEVLDTTKITLAKLPSHRIPTSFTQGMKCATDFGYWEGIKESAWRGIRLTGESGDGSLRSADNNIRYLNRLEGNYQWQVIVEDEFDFGTGKLIKRVGKVVLDGSVPIYDTKSIGEEYTYMTILGDKLGIKCRNSFSNGSYGFAISSTVPFKVDYGGEFNHMFVDGNNLIIIIKNNELGVPTKEGIAKYFESNPMTVYYELAVPEISYVDVLSHHGKTVNNATALRTNYFLATTYLQPQIKPSHLTYPVPSLVGNRTYTVVHNRKNITGSTKPITLDLGGTQVELNDASGKTLVKTPSTLAHSNLIFIGGESTVDHVMVLDRDWTNKPIEYFEDMKGHDTDAIITIIGDGKIDDVAEQYLW